MNSARSFSLALRFALREMRGGLSGFYIFLACIALGVAAIGGVNSVARSVSSGITAQGQSILGGDISFALNQREVTPAERAFIEKQGKMAASATMRSMARMPDGSDQSLVEVKAVDDAYPLYGTLKVSPQQSLADMTREKDGAYGAAVSRDFLDRMGLSLGARVLLGSQTFELRALIENEPDLLSSGFNFAPRFLVSLEGCMPLASSSPEAWSIIFTRLRCRMVRRMRQSPMCGGRPRPVSRMRAGISVRVPMPRRA